jgi:hypothetical protein
VPGDITDQIRLDQNSTPSILPQESTCALVRDGGVPGIVKFAAPLQLAVLGCPGRITIPGWVRQTKSFRARGGNALGAVQGS